MTAHVFVDESKRGGYLVTAAAVLPGGLSLGRQVIRGLILPGQRRLHFTHESDNRRKQILDAIAELHPAVTIYDGSAHERRRQREACLDGLIADLAATDARLLVIETDESVLELDRRILYRSTRLHGCEALEYRHHRAHEEPLLAIPDALAWCWQRGGFWKARAKEFVSDVRVV
ncbi:hypothetical protein [Amycolatopsis eburnea]|uniref:DUF3800 domain-containing protein n=1 Tax=Amycolatopsis eburnea TaxID=2267691 RepID=A0A3R9F9M9_9PSEU|nr:hypothetical protein [Amycolatopsis eburnea]RSD19259.1 hypothetical protein EIY87_13135 [Amycolatopsis eburnea]